MSTSPVPTLPGVTEALHRFFLECVCREFGDRPLNAITPVEVDNFLFKLRLATVAALNRAGAPSAAKSLLASLRENNNELTIGALAELACLDGFEVDLKVTKKRGKK